MKILHGVEFYWPSVGGAQEVVRQISERLASLGHEVTIATSRLPERASQRHKGVTIVDFPISGNAVRGYQGDIGSYQKFVAQGNFDVIMLYAAQQWTADALFPILPAVSAKKVFVPCGFSGLYWSQYHDYYRSMPKILEQFDALVFLSKDYRDINFTKTIGLKKFTVIPNGAGADEFLAPPVDFRKKYGIKTKFLLLTVGGHTGVKGHRLTLDAFRKSHVRDATLVIIANSFGGGCTNDCARRSRWYSRLPWMSRRNKVIRVIEAPRVDTVGAYHQADLFVFCSNIECSPLVLFEAMAARLPFVSLPTGNAREIAAWSQGGLIVDAEQNREGFTVGRARDVAAAIDRLIADPAARTRMAAAGFRAWQERFTFEKIAEHYLELYQAIQNNQPLPSFI